MRVAINGEFMVRTMTGQERFAYETLLCLDQIVNKNTFVLVVPQYTDRTIDLKSIDIVRFGRLKAQLWEQINFAYYTMKNKMVSLNLCSIFPIIKPGVVCIHDISYKVNPQYFKNMYGRMSAIWHRLHYWVAARKALWIYTVSEFSKNQICEVYGVEPEKVKVLYNGWQHFLRVDEDESVFDDYPDLVKGKYYFAVGSLVPSKNFEWILQVARKNPQSKFAISGKVMGYSARYDTRMSDNIVMLGFVSDERVKSLMRNCKAFLFPSKFEGFGIPPLEALSVGATCIVSNASCLPEIYGESVHYIDPTITDVDLEALLKVRVSGSEAVLEKYSFANTAKIIKKDMTKLVSGAVE